MSPFSIFYKPNMLCPSRTVIYFDLSTEAHKPCSAFVYIYIKTFLSCKTWHGTYNCGSWELWNVSYFFDLIYVWTITFLRDHKKIYIWDMFGVIIEIYNGQDISTMSKNCIDTKTWNTVVIWFQRVYININDTSEDPWFVGDIHLQWFP